MVPIKNEGVCAQSRKPKNETEMYNWDWDIQDNSLPLILRDSGQAGKTRQKEYLLNKKGQANEKKFHRKDAKNAE